MIDRWAEVSGDFNPVHVDPEFARNTRFGTTIAHGHISLAFCCEMLTAGFGRDWLQKGRLMDVKFTAPVRPGDTVTAKGIVLEAGDAVVCEIWLENQQGEKCVVGKAEMST